MHSSTYFELLEIIELGFSITLANLCIQKYQNVTETVNVSVTVKVKVK